jgi:hypothetical protein
MKMRSIAAVCDICFIPFLAAQWLHFSREHSFSSQKLPVDAPNNAVSCEKKGTGTSTNVLGLFAFGDASIASAKKTAGITKVDSVDVAHTGVLGLFGLN